jgi:hypothetical protein
MHCIAFRRLPSTGSDRFSTLDTYVTSYLAMMYRISMYDVWLPITTAG